MQSDLNSKSEYLNSKQILIPQFSKFSRHSGIPLDFFNFGAGQTHRFKTLGFRLAKMIGESANLCGGIWDLFRISPACRQGRDFGFRISTSVILFWILCFGICHLSFAQETEEEPIIVNGDVVEYFTDTKEFTASGNVEVNYKGAKLTCQKLTVNAQTKDSLAEGNARLDDKGGVIEGSKIIYNFNTKVGTIIDSEFRSNPYFGNAEKTKKISDDEFIAFRGYLTTCSYDNPHYRIKSKKMDFFPGDKIQTKDDILYLGRIPLFYAPQYNHSLKDPLIHVQLMPGKTKDWGQYLLTAWRYNITEDIRGRLYFDYREQLGVAEGFGLNYTTQGFGKGDYKYYYTQERSRKFDEGIPAEFQRYLIRWRHKWEIDEQTDAIMEYYKIVDAKKILHGGNSILKDYFFREYEKDAQPLSYILVHRNFRYSSMDFLIQKRVNRWYSQGEMLPEIRYSLPSLQLARSPFYFQNSVSYVNLNQKNAVPSPSSADVTKNKFDTSNKFSLPMKIAFVSLTPFASSQQVFSDKDIYGATLQNVFSTGSDLSTKFYRIFNVRTNFLRLDINGLRHIITPTIAYSYTHNSTIPTREMRISRSSSVRSSSVSLGLSNKLQIKRNREKVDMADFRVSSSYAIKPKTGDKIGSSFSDFLFELDLRPYSWLRSHFDTTYQHSGNDSDANANYKHISGANYDFNFDFGKERSIAIGQRYQRKGGNEITYSFNWRLSPKWRFSLYQRRNRGHSPALKRGLREQEYAISRDFHCWTVDFTYNIRKGQGESVWFIFRLKAFPELEFEYNQAYHAPKPGSQSNP